MKWGLESIFLTTIPCCSELALQLKFHGWGSTHPQKFLLSNPTPRWVKWARGEINKDAWVPWTYSPKSIFHWPTMPHIKQVPFYNLNFCFFYLDSKFKNQVGEIHRELLQKVCKKKWSYRGSWDLWVGVTRVEQRTTSEGSSHMNGALKWNNETNLWAIQI